MFVDIMRRKFIHFRFNYKDLAQRQQKRKARVRSLESDVDDDVTTDEEEDVEPFRATNEAAKLSTSHDSSCVLVFQLPREKFSMISDNVGTQEVSLTKTTLYDATNHI